MAKPENIVNYNYLEDNYMQNFDIGIIRNGILAYSSAFALITKDPTLKIAIIELQDRSGGASVASGAMLDCFGEVTKQNT